MPTLKIPDENRRGLVLLKNMTAEAFASALVAIEQSPDSVPIIQGLSPEEAQEFKDALDAMYAVRVYADVDIEEFLTDVCDSLRSTGDLQGDEVAFQERLARVLTIEPLSVAAKAVLLQNEHEHDFCSSRILTDIRAVFGEDPTAPPAAAIISHTLKISYHEGAGGRLQEIYFSMGSRDLKDLRDVLDRAEKKTDGLRAVIRNSNIRLIDPQD